MTGARIKARLSGGSRPTDAQFWPILLLPDRADGVVSDQGQMAVGSGGPHQQDLALLYLLSSSFTLSSSALLFSSSHTFQGQSKEPAIRSLSTNLL